jgi:hypothetical protein
MDFIVKINFLNPPIFFKKFVKQKTIGFYSYFIYFVSLSNLRQLLKIKLKYQNIISYKK